VHSYGDEMMFTTGATGAPLATTLQATGIGADFATLNGSVNALCFATTVTFEYGLTVSYGMTINATPGIVDGGSDTPVSAYLSGLTVNQTYHFRVKAVSANGTTYGNDMTFSTGANPPTVTTLAASNIGNFAARLNGTVNANGQNTTVTFQYGLTNAYGTTVPGVPATAAGPITGPDDVCQATSGHVYTVSPIQYATGYTWTVPAGGTIVAGANTNSITVDYNNTAVSGDVTVYGVSICGNGAPAVLPVTINPLPVPVITGPATTCITSTYTYSTAAGMTGYIWAVSAGGQIMTGAGTNSVTIKWNSAGAQWVSVTYTSAAGCQAAAPAMMNVTVGTLPSPTIAGANIVCVNGGLQVYTTEAGFSNYVWTISQGGTIVNGQGTYQVEVDWLQPGNRNISVNYDNSYGCDAANPATFAVEVKGLPGNAGPVDGPLDVCAGTQAVEYDTPPIPNADNYIWTLPAGATIVEGEFTSSIKVDFALDAESGDISVYGENLCGSGQSSPPYDVTVNPIPPTPVASVDEDFMLHSTASEGNQWYFEGTLIEGATGQTYQAEEEGMYWTIVTLNECVSEPSNQVEVIFTGINEPDGSSFSIYPIPNDGKFTATIVIQGDDTFTIKVYNELGNNIYEKKDVYVAGKAQQYIDLNNPAKGIYSVVFQGKNKTVIRKVLVTR
jgi:hypothetical protein